MGIEKILKTSIIIGGGAELLSSVGCNNTILQKTPHKANNEERRTEKEKTTKTKKQEEKEKTQQQREDKNIEKLPQNKTNAEQENHINKSETQIIKKGLDNAFDASIRNLSYPLPLEKKGFDFVEVYLERRNNEEHQGFGFAKKGFYELQFIVDKEYNLVSLIKSGLNSKKLDDILNNHKQEFQKILDFGLVWAFLNYIGEHNNYSVLGEYEGAIKALKRAINAEKNVGNVKTLYDGWEVEEYLEGNNNGLKEKNMQSIKLKKGNEIIFLTKYTDFQNSFEKINGKSYIIFVNEEDYQDCKFILYGDKINNQPYPIKPEEIDKIIMKRLKQDWGFKGETYAQFLRENIESARKIFLKLPSLFKEYNK
ncbi:hypothetical protein DRN73_10165 [Candidatus Pacearchaeota archaeon]|nr:MAG: hypothetical protein DRN73_10165 [Candidatus Pacearchaeota archaeon]